MALSPEVITSAGLGAAVVAILASIAGKFLAPRFLQDRLDHETKVDKELVALHTLLVQIRDSSNTLIFQVRDTASKELNDLSTRWHDRMDKVNVLVGGISVQTDRNEKDIANLAAIVRGAESAANRVEGKIEGLTTAVNALAAAYKRNGV